MRKNLLKLMLVAAGSLASTNVIAAGYDFKEGDIYYNITSKENRTVEVTNSLGGTGGIGASSDYSGDVVFPSTVVHNDTTYAVTAIGYMAMCNSYEVISVVVPATIDTIKPGALRLVFERDANGEAIRTERFLPKVTIEWGDSILYYSNAAISADSVFINREMKFFERDSWGQRLIWNVAYLEFGDSVSVIPAGLSHNNATLKEVKFPNRPFTFDVHNNDFFNTYGLFQDCIALEKVDLSNLVPARSYYEWVDYDNGGGYYNELTSITNAYFIPPMTFKGCTALKEVILPDTLVYKTRAKMVNGVADYDGVNGVTGNNYFIGASAFEGCSSLESISFPVAKLEYGRTGIQWIGSRAFTGSGLKTLTLPNFISYLGKKAFSECPSLESVTLPTAFEWQKPADRYGEYMSYNNYFLSENVFGNCPKLKTVDFGGAVTVVVPNAFVGSKVENLKLNSVSDIQNGNFSSQYLSSIEVGEGNTAYKFEESILKTYDGKQWLLTTGKNYTGATVLKNDTVEVIKAQLFDGLPIESYDFPMLATVGDRAFANTNLKTVAIADTISYGVEAFADCKLLEACAIDAAVTNLPAGLFKNCELLSGSIEVPSGVKMLNDEVFSGTGFTEFTIGDKIELIRESAMPMGTTDITIYASIPPEVVEVDSIEYISNVTLVVPSECVEEYATHGFWGRAKSIVANGDYEGHSYSGDIVPAPNGLYFAKKDGNICYFDGENVIDTYIPAGSHTFQLASWHGAIYAVNAGDQYVYVNDADNTLGDGELYVVYKREEGFSKSTVVNNKNRGDGKPYQAFLDPYHILIDNDSIYYTNRSFNVAVNDNFGYGLSVLPAKEYYEDPYMASCDVPVFAAGNLLPYYGRGINYGTIHAGFQRDSEGVYWHAFHYNGNGIFRYKQSDIYANSSEASAASTPYPIAASGIKPTAMFLDEKNDFIYVFSRDMTNHGVYRMPISTIRNGGTTTFPSAWELIDNSPASPENNTSDEGVYVRQFTSDGNYIYWAYIAEEGSGNKSGIKRVNATGTPVVEYVVEDVEAYGVCSYVYDGSRSVKVTTVGNSVNFEIPTAENASTYTVNVYADEAMTQLVKTVNYDATGKIIPMSDTFEVTIEGLDDGDYFYDVVAKSAAGESVMTYSGSFIIDQAGISGVYIDNSATEVARYDIHGRLLTVPTTGVNVVKMSDGTTRKEVVK